MQPAEYEFTHTWTIPASREVVSEAILRSEDWQSWWAGLESVEILDEVHGAGSRYICTWKSGGGYRLRTDITVTEYEKARHIYFDSDGDLVGKGSFMIHATDTTPSTPTTIVITWNVVTTKAWMQRLSFLLRPLFTFFHHRIMQRGEAGLREYIHVNNGRLQA